MWLVEFIFSGATAGSNFFLNSLIMVKVWPSCLNLWPTTSCFCFVFSCHLDLLTGDRSNAWARACFFFSSSICRTCASNTAGVNCACAWVLACNACRCVSLSNVVWKLIIPFWILLPRATMPQVSTLRRNGLGKNLFV